MNTWGLNVLFFQLLYLFEIFYNKILKGKRRVPCKQASQCSIHGILLTVMGKSACSISSKFCSKMLRTSANAGTCHAALGLVLFTSFTKKALHVTHLLRLLLFERHHYRFKNISAIFLIGSFISSEEKHVDNGRD